MNSSSGNNFALELTVGIQDLFTQQYKRIEKETNDLEQDFKTLQKTAGDVTQFKRLKEGLEDVGRESGSTSQEFLRQERELQRYSQALRKAEVNIDRLTQEQKRLNTELRQTEKSAKSIGQLGEYMKSAVGMAAGGYSVASLARAGLDTASQERLAAFQTGSQVGTFSTKGQRAWRHDMQRKTGFPQAEVLDAQIIARQGGANDQQSMLMTEQALSLRRATGDQWDAREIMTGIRALMKSFGVDEQRAGDLMYSAYTQTGDLKGDFLDTLNEYSGLAEMGGLNAEQFVGMLIGGVKGGAFNFDKVADGLKEALMARLSDPGEIEKLMGHGKTRGDVELIKDPKQRQAFKDAMAEYRSAQTNHEPLVAPLTKLMSQAQALFQSDPESAKVIWERLGGVMWSEDISSKATGNMINGLQAPEFALGSYQGALANGLKESFSSVEEAANSLGATSSNLGAAFADLTEAVRPLTDLLVRASDAIGGSMDESPVLGQVGAAAVAGGASILTLRKLKFLTGWLNNLKGGAPEPTSSPPGSTPKPRTPSWMDHRLGGGAEPPTPKGSMWGSLWRGLGPQLAVAYGTAIAPEFSPVNVRRKGDISAGLSPELQTLAAPGLLDVWDEWRNWLGLGEPPSPPQKEDAELERLVAPPALRPPAQEAPRTSVASTPPIQIALTHNVTVSPDFANSTDLEGAMTRVLRSSSPELMQELQSTLERMMQGMDYAQPSS